MLALATQAYQERGEGSARDEPHVEPRAPRDASAASLDATERDSKTLLLMGLLIRLGALWQRRSVPRLGTGSRLHRRQ